MRTDPRKKIISLVIALFSTSGAGAPVCAGWFVAGDSGVYGVL